MQKFVEIYNSPHLAPELKLKLGLAILELAQQQQTRLEFQPIGFPNPPCRQLTREIDRWPLCAN